MAEVTRTEYSLLVDQVGGPVRLGPEDRQTLEARSQALGDSIGSWPSAEIFSVEIQQRTVVTSDWEPLREEEDR